MKITFILGSILFISYNSVIKVCYSGFLNRCVESYEVIQLHLMFGPMDIYVPLAANRGSGHISLWQRVGSGHMYICPFGSKRINSIPMP